jgi:hypothetical protein
MKMKATSVILLAAVTSVLIQSVRADSTDATCEFYKHGDAKHDRWGACSFSQRQGYIDITLKNGTSYSLSPRDDANQYKDQEGNKVERTKSSSSGQVYEWKNDQQKLVVKFNASNSSTTPTAAAQPPEVAKGACLFKIGETAKVVATNQLSDGEWELVLKRAAGGKQVYCTVTNDGTIKNWSEM